MAIEEKIIFVNKFKNVYDVKKICKVINLPRSVYYYHAQNRPNSYALANKELDEKILDIYSGSNSRYGAPKITKALKANGTYASIKRVQRRMKMLNIRSITIKKYKPASVKAKQEEKTTYHNLINQDFKADKPGNKLVGDITYIYTAKQGPYLAIVMDLFDHKVIGYSYGLNMSDDLSTNALKKALANRSIDKDCVFHSDRGVQYTSNKYEALLQENGVQHSYSKKGYPYDNAAMESFNASLKKEEVNLKSYNDYNEAKLAIFEYIESWYNLRRIHSSNGYLTPEQKYQEYLANQIVS